MTALTVTLALGFGMGVGIYHWGALGYPVRWAALAAVTSAAMFGVVVQIIRDMVPS